MEMMDFFIQFVVTGDCSEYIEIGGEVEVE